MHFYFKDFFFNFENSLSFYFMGVLDACMSMHHVCGAHRGQGRALDSPEL